MIQEQVRLPYNVAFQVVMQGVRIRFGRSVVTITGVVMGIAFLMSILTGQSLRAGVGAEDRMRAEITWMANYLTGEMGPPAGRTIGVVQTGAFRETEVRLLQDLEDKGLAGVRWAQTEQEPMPEVFSNLEVQIVSPAEVARDVSALVIIGSGVLPDVNWDRMMDQARQKVVAHTRHAIVPPVGRGIAVVNLDRQLSEEEIARTTSDQTRAKFRSVWIVVISLLVTVIGVSNAMLMSVTERFREIGTMKCLGALSAFVRLTFLIESGLMGIVGGVAGCLIGMAFSVIAYSASYGVGLTLLSLRSELAGMGVHVSLCLVTSVGLSMLAAIYPANVASRMVPADALRTNV